MGLAHDLFTSVDVRPRSPQERLYRLVEQVLDNSDVDCWLDRLTWDWYDASVEIYLDEDDIDTTGLDLSRLYDEGFISIWVHPRKCTKDGRRDCSTCRCPRRLDQRGKAPSEDGK
jgi:hypothetical protein